MIYFITLSAGKQAVEEFLIKQGFSKRKNDWIYGDCFISNYTSYIDKEMGRTTIKLDLPSTPRYTDAMEEKGFKAGKNIRCDFESLESLLKEITAYNIIKAVEKIGFGKKFNS